MSDERPPSLLGGLPRSRPHRRSDKRPAVPLHSVETPAPEASGVAQPRTRPHPDRLPAAVEPDARDTVAPPASAADTGPLGTAVQAAAELAEIGLMASARALRGALSRLPRP